MHSVAASLDSFSYPTSSSSSSSSSSSGNSVLIYQQYSDPMTTYYLIVSSIYCYCCRFIYCPVMYLTGLSFHHNSIDESVGESALSIPMVQVDAHNIVPCWVASNKLEYSARTIRSKIQSLLPTYLPHLPPPLAHNPPTPQPLLDVYAPVDWDAGESVGVLSLYVLKLQLSFCRWYP